MKNPRLLWSPKLKVMPEQCISCPFREGNDDEFGKICDRLNPELQRLSPKKRALRIEMARFQLREETAHFGDLSCHQSAYNPDMTVKPYREHRQCPGAAKHFVSLGERGQKKK